VNELTVTASWSLGGRGHEASATTHLTRQFKAATGLAPYQYVIARRVERAQHLLRRDGEIGLAEVALRVGFSDQSHFSLHFKRIVGVTPRQFRISARIA
jgi:AraC family transcriptional regulator